MAEWVEIEEARRRPGLRLVLTAGVPGPWGESAKSLFRVKGIPFVKVRQTPGVSEPALWDWTRQTSAPVAIYEDERPRSSWLEILELAERLAPTPSLVPDDSALRVRLFGLAHEICGERGFGWERRLMMLHPLLASDPDTPIADGVPARLGRKYGYTPAAGAGAPRRVAAILETLAAQLRSQRERGQRFLIGDRLSALDLYWAAFAALIEPLPPELCPMDAGLRAAYTLRDPVVTAAVDPRLMEHRDAIYREYLELPLDL